MSNPERTFHAHLPGIWIPVGEGLPTTDRNVLITATFGPSRFVCEARYDDGWGHEEMGQFQEDLKVLAWMEMPKPWSGP